MQLAYGVALNGCYSKLGARQRYRPCASSVLSEPPVPGLPEQLLDLPSESDPKGESH